jgi:hypothetical protein
MWLPVAVALGVLNLVPFAYAFYFIGYMFSLKLGEPFENNWGIPTFVVVLLLTTVYLVMAYRSPNVPDDKRTVWAVVLVMVNVISFPVFWYLYVWRPGMNR